jgi:3-oxoacyl-[acyl-carrier-protein] synthase-3
MAFLEFSNVSIAGISACVPQKIERNIDYDLLTLQDRIQLIKTTGVEERRVADENTTASDLCEKAAEALIAKLGWSKEDIQLLIFLSQSPDYFLPATSVILQHKLNLSSNCICFDVNLGCSGYVYALSVAASYISSGNISKALVLCGDKSTLSASRNDKSTYPLFGDAGSATALVFDKENTESIKYNLKSDGEGYRNIIIPEGACRSPFSLNSLSQKHISDGIERNGIQLVLDGTKVFDFSLSHVLPTIKESLTKYNSSINDIDFFVFHQANLLMNETLRKILKLPVEKTPVSIRKYGNTSSASIPLTIVTELKQQLKDKNSKLLLCGFGVGFSWGTTILQVSNPIIVDLIEY